MAEWKIFHNFASKMKNEKPNNNYRVLALDDHPVVIEGLKHVLSDHGGNIAFNGVTTTAALHDLLKQGEHYDFFILDLELPDGDSFAEIATIRSYCPGAAILIYTMHEEPWVVARLAKLDIQGIISKANTIGSVAKAVEAIRRGGEFL